MAVIDDSVDVIRIERPWGAIVITNNEVTIESVVDDPPGLRLHSKSDSLGKVSFAKIRADGSADEYALVQGKKDERTRGRDDLSCGELTVHIKGPERATGDDGMRPVFTALHDYVWVKGINGAAPDPPVLVLPAPPPPETTPGDGFTPAQRLQFVSAIGHEFGFPPDPQSAARYIAQGHSPSFKELHDDMLPRNNGQHDVSRHHPDAPY